MDKDHKIWESSDSEFLSFLYAERDREYSKYSAWGVNLWVVAAAVIGLFGYAYSQISQDYDSFDWHLFVLYSNVLGAILIAIVTIAHPLILNARWSNEYRVTTVRSNVQMSEIRGKMYIACSSIIFLGYWSERNIVYYLWIVLLGIEFSIWLYVYICGDKLIRMNRVGHVFANEWLEVLYRGIEWVLCSAILCVAIKVWGEFTLGAKEFEMGCVFAIIVSVLWVTLFRIFESRHECIDTWIDQYIYGNLSKEDAYLYMLEYAQGYDVVDVIRSDLEKIQSIRNKMKDYSEMHKRYLKLSKNKELKYAECNKYIEDFKRESAMIEEVHAVIDHLSSRLKEIVELDTRTTYVDIMYAKMEDLKKFMEEYETFQKEANCVIAVLDGNLQSFECTKYGGLCSKMDCTHRNEQKSILYAMKHRLATIRIRIK